MPPRAPAAPSAPARAPPRARAAPTCRCLGRRARAARRSHPPAPPTRAHRLARVPPHGQRAAPRSECTCRYLRRRVGGPIGRERRWPIGQRRGGQSAGPPPHGQVATTAVANRPACGPHGQVATTAVANRPTPVATKWPPPPWPIGPRPHSQVATTAVANRPARRPHGQVATTAVANRPAALTAKWPPPPWPIGPLAAARPPHSSAPARCHVAARRGGVGRGPTARAGEPPRPGSSRRRPSAAR